ncbi:hypothetical protein OG625_27095 [Streptomyces sp. NBC_01351]|uniref:hypothetical protein n=1 Tax=Streptomyces sp. NBC_01351 TaxID=2903833 RepID=UPI002E31A85D|nr:hypothetical protein [Streptomyces sp. NBC_01351]
MGLFDKLTGTRRPGSGITPLSAAEVRAALLSLDGPDMRFVLRNGTPKERADLVAVWRIPEGPWHLKRGQTRLRLVPAAREVRALDEKWETPESGELTFNGTGLKYSRGPVGSVSKQWTVERDQDGRRRLKEESSFSSAEVKAPLRDAVLAAGWTWRGVFRP